MAARNADVSVPRNTWTQLTDSDVTAITFLNTGARSVFIQATVGAVAPSTLSGALIYPPGFGEDSSKTLAQLFPGVSGATRVYAYSDSATIVKVSHA